LKEQLPEYMLPSAFVCLEALPLTSNGKVDHRALPALDTVRLEQAGDYVAPRTPAEEILASIWAQVLHLERVSIHGNFFDLGGHSLLAAQIIIRLHNTFQIDLPMSTIFRSPTIADLTVVIEEMLMDEIEDLDEEDVQRLTAI
jgi:acyl carrier protein